MGRSGGSSRPPQRGSAFLFDMIFEGCETKAEKNERERARMHRRFLVKFHFDFHFYLLLEPWIKFSRLRRRRQGDLATGCLRQSLGGAGESLRRTIPEVPPARAARLGAEGAPESRKRRSVSWNAKNKCWEIPDPTMRVALIKLSQASTLHTNTK